MSLVPALRLDPAERVMTRFTAAQIEKNCPVEVENIGKRIAAHCAKLVQCEDKAGQHKIAIGQLLAQVQQSCDEGGFEAFRERFCPKLGKSRAHELLQIASGKKSIDEVRAATRERVTRHREKAKSAPPLPPEPSVTVTDKAEVPPAADDPEASAERRKQQYAADEPKAPSPAPSILRWRDLDLDDLEAAIFQEQQRARHTPGGLSPAEYRRLDKAKARKLACAKANGDIVVQQEAGASELHSLIEREWSEAEGAFEALTSRTTEQVAKAIPPERAALVTEIADFFVELKALLARPASNGALPAYLDRHAERSAP
jgi:hypothetical protein